MRLIRGIWALSRAIAIGEGSISDLGEATLYIFLCIIFLIVAVVLMLFGINLDAADHWLDAQADWFEWAGMIAFKGVCAFVLLICLFFIGGGIYESGQRLVHPRKQIKRRAPRRGRHPKQIEGPPVDDEGDQRMGWGGVILAVIIGYFAYVCLTMPRDAFM
jgi:amino acid transporter